MAKIIIDAREFSTSTGRYISKLIEYLEKVDNIHTYIILLKSKDLDKYVPGNNKFTKQVADFKEFSPSEQLGFAKFLYRANADLVHFGMTQQPVLYLKPSVTTVHDLTMTHLEFLDPSKNRKVMKVKQQIYQMVLRYAAFKSKCIITATEYVKKDLVNYTHVRPRKVIVTHEAADLITEKTEPSKELVGKKFIMYIGRPMPHKNLWRLIEAFDSLKGIYPDLILVLAGKMDKNYSEIKRRVSSNGFRDIIFTDYVSEGELRWLYENCRAYVFPSLSEGFGLPGLEAMMHGAPVVSSNATCLPEIYGDAAHYFDPRDKQSMVTAINEVLADNELRLKLIQNGKERSKNYSWKKMAEQTLEVYNQALK